MPEDEEDPKLTPQRESLQERIRRLEVQGNRLVETPSMAAREFVVVDEHHRPRARFELAGHSPQVVLFDATGRERRRIGLHTDGSPALWVEAREGPLGFPKHGNDTAKGV